MQCFGSSLGKKDFVLTIYFQIINKIFETSEKIVFVHSIIEDFWEKKPKYKFLPNSRENILC